MIHHMVQAVSKEIGPLRHDSFFSSITLWNTVALEIRDLI